MAQEPFGKEKMDSAHFDRNEAFNHLKSPSKPRFQALLEAHRADHLSENDTVESHSVSRLAAKKRLR